MVHLLKIDHLAAGPNLKVVSTMSVGYGERHRMQRASWLITTHQSMSAFQAYTREGSALDTLRTCSLTLVRIIPHLAAPLLRVCVI
jgi:hypothetical protein